MKKVTILFGPKASGKTVRANKIINGRKSVTIYGADLLSPFCFESVDTDTEVIVFEELTDIRLINFLIDRQHLTVNKYNLRPFTIECPEIIINTQKLQEHLLQMNESVEIIHCVHHDPWPVVLDEYQETSKSDVAKLKESCR